LTVDYVTETSCDTNWQSLEIVNAGEAEKEICDFHENVAVINLTAKNGER
jgi:hypothetical protein